MADCPAHQQALEFRGKNKALRDRYDKQATAVAGAGLLAPLSASLAALGIGINRVGEFSVNSLLDNCLRENDCERAIKWYRAAQALAVLI